MKILAFAASNSRQSINKALVTHATEVFKQEINPQAEITLLDLNDFEMPIFSIDRETENGIPDQAHKFFNAIGEADGLIISFAEHNGLYSAAFKNIFDWASRINRKLYQDKPILALSTSPGPGGAGNVMKVVINGAPHFAGEVVASLSVPSFGKSFDSEKGALTDGDLRRSLSEKLNEFAKAMNK